MREIIPYMLLQFKLQSDPVQFPLQLGYPQIISVHKSTPWFFTVILRQFFIFSSVPFINNCFYSITAFCLYYPYCKLSVFISHRQAYCMKLSPPASFSGINYPVLFYQVVAWYFRSSDPSLKNSPCILYSSPASLQTRWYR